MITRKKIIAKAEDCTFNYDGVLLLLRYIENSKQKLQIVMLSFLFLFHNVNKLLWPGSVRIFIIISCIYEIIFRFKPIANPPVVLDTRTLITHTAFYSQDKTRYIRSHPYLTPALKQYLLRFPHVKSYKLNNHIHTLTLYIPNSCVYTQQIIKFLMNRNIWTLRSR